LCERGEAGLSLRDITYMQTDASRLENELV